MGALYAHCRLSAGLDVSNLYVVGCRSYTLNHGLQAGHNLDPRAAIGWLVGFVASNIYRVWTPALRRVMRAPDVTFDETILYKDQPDRLDADVNTVNALLAVVDIIALPNMSVSIPESTSPPTSSPRIEITTPGMSIQHRNRLQNHLFRRAVVLRSTSFLILQPPTTLNLCRQRSLPSSQHLNHIPGDFTKAPYRQLRIVRKKH